jgi:hypothetical protein
MRPHVRLPAGLAAAAGVALAATACGHHTAPHASARAGVFHSRPDLHPAHVVVTKRLPTAAPGDIFLAPKKKVPQAGPLIIDDKGWPVWIHPVRHGATDFRVQRYRGRPVLTWWQGTSTKGVGRGRYEIYDASYRRIREVRAGHGYAGDEHEFLLTPAGTALITIYNKVPMNLSGVGGPRHGSVYDSVVQEVDVATGKVVWEWHSLAHVGLRDSYLPLRSKSSAPYDYFHVNSVELEPSGNVLVSARHTRAVYELSRPSGRIVWQLGGKRSDIRLPANARFAWQHDARTHPDGTITVFDNGAAPPVHKQTRILVLRVDRRAKTARLVRVYTHPDHILVSSQGDAQVLPDGHVFVGWGAEPRMTEFAHDGGVLFDAHFNRGADSYRAFRFVWHGHPAGRPAIAVSRRDGGAVTVYASWNGATDISRWRVLAGSSRDTLKPVADAAPTGFETATHIDSNARLFAVRAVGRSGSVLGTSAAIRPGRVDTGTH